MANYRDYLDYIRHVDDEAEKEILDKENAIKDSYENQLAKLKEKHKAELVDQKKQHDQEVADFKGKMDAFVANVKKQRDGENKAAEDEKNRLIKKHLDEIKELKDVVTAKEQKIKELNKEISERVPKTEFQAIKDQCAKAVSEFQNKTKTEIEKVTKELSEANEKINTMQDEIVKDANKQIKEIQKKISEDANAEILEVRRDANTMIDEVRWKAYQNEEKLTNEIAKLKLEIKSKDQIINEMKNRSFKDKLTDLFNKKDDSI